MRKPRKIFEDGKYRCGKCKEIKEVKFFIFDKFNNRCISHCKSCLKKKQQENKEYTNKKAKKSRLKLQYGITLSDYDTLFIKQEGKCVICQKHVDELGKELCVDHCHKSKKVRGLLCHNCNHGLGKFGDNVENLNRAINYLINNQ